MLTNMLLLALFVVLLPLFSGALVGILNKRFPLCLAQLLTILCIALSFAGSLILFYQFIFAHASVINHDFYTWFFSNQLQLNIGFLVDPLSVLMAVFISFVSLLVHVYSIGYMSDDNGQQRFFSYISLFTFAMLVLVFANNFLLLFFGWEAVGLVSYLLIGFWFHKDSANEASLKAFYLNRIADFAFILGIAGLFSYCHTLDFARIFSLAPALTTTTLTLFPGHAWSVLTILCLLIFFGAMGKSAQMPLHVWLPESMEGPTPISALIHAATMVTAGVYLLARLSPLYQLSTTALSVVLIIGATSALFMGILGIVQTDIKRVIAYSTLSQLGYMMAGAGASAYAASMFHLFTHACFKALLFLAAGAVIIALHHEQDIRKMGALGRRLPLTYITFLVGALALIALPPTSGFYSKDSIIEAVSASTLVGHSYANFCLTAGVFFTALYTFRCFFMVFHTRSRLENPEAVQTPPASMMIPLVLLAIPSLGLGYFLIQPLLVDSPSWFGQTLSVLPANNTLTLFAHEFISATHMFLNAFHTTAFWLMVAGVLTAWVGYVLSPSLPEKLSLSFSWIYKALLANYGFDAFNRLVFVKGSIKLANFFFNIIDMKFIDQACVNGSGRMITSLSKLARRLQSGYLYQYVFIMILGLLMLLFWQLR